MQEIPLQQIVNTVADLRLLNPATNQIALMVGKTLVGDGLGGFYRWDSTATGAEDTYMNFIISTVNSNGRWVRVFQKARAVGGGILVNNGGVKSFYISATTGSTGEVTLNLTMDNTATGTAIFSEIWSIVPNPQTSAATPSDAVQSYRKSLSADLKTTTYGFYKANAVTITLGLFLTPVTSIGAGTNIQFRIDGI